MSDDRPPTTEQKEVERALFGGPPKCAKYPAKDCIQDCEYGIVGPCLREKEND